MSKDIHVDKHGMSFDVTVDVEGIEPAVFNRIADTLQREVKDEIDAHIGPWGYRKYAREDQLEGLFANRIEELTNDPEDRLDETPLSTAQQETPTEALELHFDISDRSRLNRVFLSALDRDPQTAAKGLKRYAEKVANAHISKLRLGC